MHAVITELHYSMVEFILLLLTIIYNDAWMVHMFQVHICLDLQTWLLHQKENI